MRIEIIRDYISPELVHTLAKESYGEMVKAVVDVERKVMAIGGEFHADAESVLLGDGSKQANLWGFNIYPDRDKNDWLEYTSLINIRPAIKNNSMEILDSNIRDQVRNIVNLLTTKKENYDK